MRSYYEHEDTEQRKRVIRSLAEPRFLQEFRFMGLGLVELDRAELLGIISQLAKFPTYGRFVVREPMTPPMKETPKV